MLWVKLCLKREEYENYFESAISSSALVSRDQNMKIESNDMLDMCSEYEYSETILNDSEVRDDIDILDGIDDVAEAEAKAEEIQFICYICHYEFATKLEIEAHMNQHLPVQIQINPSKKKLHYIRIKRFTFATHAEQSVVVVKVSNTIGISIQKRRCVRAKYAAKYFTTAHL